MMDVIHNETYLNSNAFNFIANLYFELAYYPITLVKSI